VARDFKLQSISDWEKLKEQPAAGKRVERVVVEPTDCDLIRNPDFARELANFASSNISLLNSQAACSRMHITFFTGRARRLSVRTSSERKKISSSTISSSEIGFQKSSRGEVNG